MPGSRTTPGRKRPRLKSRKRVNLILIELEASRDNAGDVLGTLRIGTRLHFQRVTRRNHHPVDNPRSFTLQTKRRPKGCPSWKMMTLIRSSEHRKKSSEPSEIFLCTIPSPENVRKMKFKVIYNATPKGAARSVIRRRKITQRTLTKDVTPKLTKRKEDIFWKEAKAAKIKELAGWIEQKSFGATRLDQLVSKLMSSRRVLTWKAVNTATQENWKSTDKGKTWTSEPAGAQESTGRAWSVKARLVRGFEDHQKSSMDTFPPTDYLYRLLHAEAGF
jgi:hypothetical protein